MSQIKFKRGETRNYDITLTDSKGKPYPDGVYIGAELRVSVDNVCITIDGQLTTLTVDGVSKSGFTFPMNDAVMVDLNTGPNRTSLWLEHSTGWICVNDQLQIIVSEGC